MKKGIIITIIIIVLLISCFYFFSSIISKYTGFVTGNTVKENLSNNCNNSQINKSNQNDCNGG